VVIIILFSGRRGRRTRANYYATAYEGLCENRVGLLIRSDVAQVIFWVTHVCVGQEEQLVVGVLGEPRQAGFVADVMRFVRLPRLLQPHVVGHVFGQSVRAV